MQHITFLVLTILSHIGASLFFAEPRFRKLPTAIIWLFYSVVFFAMPPDTRMVSYFVSFGFHLVLFFLTTMGRAVEKGFLFFSYATAYTCFSMLFNITEQKVESMILKVIFAVIWMAILQGILYRALLPAFWKVSKYVRHGWGKYYAVVLTFWALVVAQSLPAIMQPVDKKEIMVFMLTLLAYCITYVVLFASMKSMEILSQEKQKSLHSELLQAQVDAQANEAALVRQNRHDMRFHYQTLLSMANAGELDNIIAYVKQQSESIETMTTGRFCENETINNILRVYYEKAVQSQIQITIRAAVKPQINVPSPALVTIVANILENALHGTQESKSIDPWISVSIKHKAGRLVISCQNSCKYALNFLEMPDQLQGVGIHSVISTAEKYNGSCRFSAAGGIFSAVVIIDE